MPHYRRSNYRDVDVDDDLDDRSFQYNNLNANYNFNNVKQSNSGVANRHNGNHDDNRLSHHHSSHHHHQAQSQQQSSNHGHHHHHYYVCSRSPSVSPSREVQQERSRNDAEFDDRPSPDDMLKIKWMDYSPRMSRLRNQRNQRFLNKLEQFEEWDSEQYQKQKQFELAREQRHRSILERLKTQEFCHDQMRRRHESDIETLRALDTYEKEHLFVEAAPHEYKNAGPINEFRKFEAEMNNKLRILEDEIDTLNPRHKIEQSLLPRLERARDTFSVEPDVYTVTGKRVLKKPKLNGLRQQSTDSVANVRLLYDDDDFDAYSKGVKYYFSSAPASDTVLIERARIQYKLDKLQQLERDEEEQQRQQQQAKEPERVLKPIIVKTDDDQKASKLLPTSNSSEKRVLFKDEVQAKPIKESVEEELASEVVVKADIADAPSTEATAAS